MDQVQKEALEEAAKIFLPDRDDWDEPPVQIANLLSMPIRKSPLIVGNAADGKPYFEVVSCSWDVPLSVDPFTKDDFVRLKDGAIADLVGYIETNFAVFRPYPITYVPEVKYGVAFHDWRGLQYPFDVRAVTHLATGGVLKFHLTMLVARDA